MDYKSLTLDQLQSTITALQEELIIRMDISSCKNLTPDQLRSAIAAFQEELLIRNDKPKDIAIEGSTKIVCSDCGGSYTSKNKSKHVITQKHKTALENQDQLKRIAKSKTLIARSGRY